MAEEKVNENSALVSRVPIVVAQLGELKAYVVYEHEIDALDRLDENLAKEPPDSVYLNFALALIPVSASFLITLLTTTIKSDRMYDTFLTVCILTFVVGLIMLALWRRDRHSFRQSRQNLLKEREKQIQRIKNRMPPNPVAQTIRIKEDA